MEENQIDKFIPLNYFDANLHILTDNFKQRKEMYKSLLSSDNYLDGTCTLLMLSVEI